MSDALNSRAKVARTRPRCDAGALVSVGGVRRPVIRADATGQTWIEEGRLFTAVSIQGTLRLCGELGVYTRELSGWPS
jgi:hypothetical protein